MKRPKTDVMIHGAGGLLAVVLTSAAAAAPFVDSARDPHATLYLNVSQTAKQIYPVEIRAVDGKLTNRMDEGALWISPGEYDLELKVSEVVNLANLPGLQTSARFGEEVHTIKLTLEAGKSYYVGAKFDASGKWEPEVWKTEDSSG